MEFTGTPMMGFPQTSRTIGVCYEVSVGVGLPSDRGSLLFLAFVYNFHGKPRDFHSLFGILLVFRCEVAPVQGFVRCVFGPLADLGIHRMSHEKNIVDWSL